MLTKNQIYSAFETMNQIAQEKGKTSFEGTTFYYQGSEIATLRLLKTYRDNHRANQSWSENLNSFIFSLRLDS